MNHVFLVALLGVWFVGYPITGQNIQPTLTLPVCDTTCPSNKNCLEDNTTIVWELTSQKECKSYHACYGEESAYPDDTSTGIFAGRLYPVAVALGSSVYFEAKYSGDLFKPLRIYNVSQASFLGCNNATDAVATLSTGIKVPERFLSTIGYKYFIAMGWRYGYFTCNFGLRLHMNIKDATNCSGVARLPPGGKLCSGKGRCVSESFTGGMHCECCPGYTGQFCEELNACYAKPCQRGNCSDVIAGHSDAFNCTCEVGYTGHICDIDIDECSIPVEINCINGFCIDGVNLYECACDPGFHGKHCELTSNMCDSIKPCKNYGNCSRVGNRRESYVCHCAPGWFGRNCTLNTTTSSLLPQLSSICKTSSQQTTGTTSPSLMVTSISFPGSDFVSMYSSPASFNTASQFVSSMKSNPVSDFRTSEKLTFSQSQTVTAGNQLSLSITSSMTMATTMIVRPSSVLYTPNPIFTEGTTHLLPSPFTGIVSPSGTIARPASSIVPTQTPLKNQTCADSPCGEHGTCTNTVSSGLPFSCDCKYPSVGPVCTTDIELHFPYFNGNSYIEFKPISFGSSLNEFMISFHTQSDGTLLYSGHKTHRDFIKLEVTGGLLRFSADAGDKVVSVTSRENVASGNTTAASFGYDTRTGSVFISVNNGVEQQVTTRGQLLDVQLYSPLYLGGVVPAVYTQSKPDVGRITPFVGCIRELEFNDRAIELSDAVNWQSISECDLPACLAKPCENGAICVQSTEDIREYSCRCSYPYSGKNCEEKFACAVNVCNGGKCLHTSNSGVECLCQFGRGGLSCNQDINVSIPTFSVVKNHSSYIQYLTPRAAVNQLDLRMEIKFSNDLLARRGGLLFYVGLHDHLSVGSDGDYLALGVVNNRVVLQFNLGSGGINITSDELSYHQEWFTILAGRKGRDGYLYVDKKVKEASSPAPLVGLNVFGHLYLGGLPRFTMLNSEVMYTEGFRGSIKDPKIRTGSSNAWLKLSTEHSTSKSSLVAVITGLNVQDEKVNACVGGACMNNGSCQSLGASFVCRCLPQYSGMTCNDTAVPCRDYNPCEGQSTCRMRDSGFTCDCPPGKVGRYCQNDVNITTPYFGEYSYLSFSLAKIKIHSQMYLSLSFQTLKANGILFYITHDITSLSGDFLSVTLHDGQVNLIYNLGTGIAKCRSHNKIIVNQDNYVTVGRSDRISSLELNGNRTSCRSRGGATQLNVASVFYLGGVADLSQVQPLAYENSRDLTDFTGCVKKLTINDHSFDLSQRGILNGRNIVNCDTSSIVI